MSLLEACELVKEIEEVFGVSAAAAAAPMMMAAPAPAKLPRLEEKDSFDVILTAAGGNKINVIKVVRESRSWALKKPRTWSMGLRKRSKKALPRTKPRDQDQAYRSRRVRRS